MKSLRSRLFLAISLAVIIAVALTLVTAAVLVRRSVHHEALSSLGRQADLVATSERAKPQPGRLASLGTFFATQEERLAILTRDQAMLLLPASGAAKLKAGRPAQGSVTVRGTKFLYAARLAGDEAIVLLRSAKLQASDWGPFGLALLIAGLVGAALAALTALLLARALSRPIQRVASASNRLAAGEYPGPLPVRGSAEVASLAEAFNHMASELARAHEAERTFLLSVSHELKTPLTAIRGHAEGLIERVIAAPEAGQVILREARRLERLVRDLLDLARLNQHSFSVRRQPLDLAEIVRELALRYEGQAQGLGVELAAAAPAHAPAEGDQDRVLQVLSNLIENALRCTPAGGTVTISAAPGALAVEDTGPGLATDELPRAFERFFLYDRYASNRSVGTGLGLAIVKELTETMGGSVTVASQPAAGTRFVVSLPRSAAESAAAEPVGAGAPAV